MQERQKMKLQPLALAGLAFLAAVPAANAARPACIRNIDIYNFNAPNDRTLIVESIRHVKYKVSFIGTCQSLSFKEQIAFKTPGSTQLSCLSKGDQVISRDFGMRQTCTISDIQLYTPEMQAADKAAKEAKKHHSNY